MSTPRPRLTGSTALAIAMALFLLSGRWDLGRVLSMDGSALTAPRVWLVVLIGFVALIPVSRRARPALPPVGLLAFFGYFLLSTMWAPDDALAVAKAGDLLVMALGLLCLRRLTLLAGVRATTAALWRVVAALFGAFAAMGLLSSILSGTGRLSILGGGPNVFGRNMGLLCVFALERSLLVGPRGSGLLKRALWPSLAAFAATLVALTGSRGAMVATALGLGCVLIFGRARLGRRLLVLASFLVLGLAIVAFTEVGARVVESFAQRVLDLLIRERYVSSRDEIYAIALERGADRPGLGHGLASFPAYTQWVYAHNLMLDAWFETGAVGVGLLGIYLATWTAGVREELREGARVVHSWAGRGRACAWASGLPEIGAFRAGAVLMLAAAQFSGGRYDARALLVFAALSVLVRSRPRATPAGSARRRPRSPAR